MEKYCIKVMAQNNAEVKLYIDAESVEDVETKINEYIVKKNFDAESIKKVKKLTINNFKGDFIKELSPQDLFNS